MKKILFGIMLGMIFTSTTLALAQGVLFSDIKNGTWYTTPVNELQKIGVIKGYQDGTFKPNKQISRAEVASMIYAFKEYNDKTYIKTKEYPQGTIEGSLSYRDQKDLPTDAKVCAENIHTKDLYCTQSFVKDAKYASGTGYSLQVPAGQYQVYTQSKTFDQENNQQNYRAYYSEYIKCGMGQNCTSHTPQNIDVYGNKTTSDINPNDWSNLRNAQSNQ